jgi:DNA-binding protein YbaB
MLCTGEVGVSVPVEDRMSRYLEMKDEISRIRATANSTDRAATVVAGPGGSVLDLRLSEQSFGSSSPKALAGSIMSALRLAVADAARQQAEIVQRYVGDRLNIAERVMATQQEVLGDKIEAGEAECERLAEQARRAAAESVLERPEQYGDVPPVQQIQQIQQGQQLQPVPQRVARHARPAEQRDDDGGFDGLSGGEGW